MLFVLVDERSRRWGSLEIGGFFGRNFGRSRWDPMVLVEVGVVGGSLDSLL